MPRGIMAFLAGLLLALWASEFWPGFNAGYALIGGWLLLAAARRPLGRLALLGFAGACFGLWRGSITAAQLAEYRHFTNQQVLVRATVVDNSLYSENGQSEFYVKSLNFLEPRPAELIGKLRIRARGAHDVRRGDVVQLAGRLYPGFGSRQGSISFAEVEILERHDSPALTFRDRMFMAVRAQLPEPQASLGLGFLVGYRGDIPEDLNEQLSATGLTHIVAASGYNLTILVVAANRLLAKRSKYLATMGSIALLATFLTISGGQASIVRAALVSGLSLWAGYFGRQISAWLLLLLPAALTAMADPLWLWSDLGWHLSFLAFVGVLIVAPAIRDRFWQGEPKLLGGILLETSAAQLTTLPYILFIFGRLSPISLAANLVVLPFIPLSMLLVFIAGLGAWFAPMAAGWLAWPAVVVMRFITDAVALLGRSELKVAYLGPLAALVCYGLMVLLLVALRRGRPDSMDKLAKV